MHLIRRFFGFITATPLAPHEQQLVEDVLPGRLAKVFFAQRYEDQRHAFEVYQRVHGLEVDQAALLHDIGKTTSDLGAVARALATLWNGLGLPLRGRWLLYIDHGDVGASMLEDLGADNLAVMFTRFHPGDPPDGSDPAIWRALASADDI